MRIPLVVLLVVAFLREPGSSNLLTLRLTHRVRRGENREGSLTTTGLLTMSFGIFRKPSQSSSSLMSDSDSFTVALDSTSSSLLQTSERMSSSESDSSFSGGFGVAASSAGTHDRALDLLLC